MGRDDGKRVPRDDEHIVVPVGMYLVLESRLEHEPIRRRYSDRQLAGYFQQNGFLRVDHRVVAYARRVKGIDGPKERKQTII